MSTKVVINLPVADPSRSITFFKALGYAHNPQFTDVTGACIVISDTIYVMALAQIPRVQIVQMDVWTCDAHPWDQMNTALPKFEKYPSQT